MVARKSQMICKLFLILIDQEKKRIQALLWFSLHSECIRYGLNMRNSSSLLYIHIHLVTTLLPTRSQTTACCYIAIAAPPLCSRALTYPHSYTRYPAYVWTLSASSDGSHSDNITSYVPSLMPCVCPFHRCHTTSHRVPWAYRLCSPQSKHVSPTVAWH